LKISETIERSRLGDNLSQKSPTTLNELFRHWLKNYAHREQQALEALAVMRELQGKLRVGRQLTREEMNER